MNTEVKKQPDPQSDETAPSPPSKQALAQEVAAPEANTPAAAALENGKRGTPAVVPKPEETSEPVASPTEGRTPAASSSDQPQVHVTPHLLDLVTGRSATPAEQRAAREQRNLNEVVHQMLIIGLIVSTTLMLIGLGLDLVLGREAPTVVPDFADVFNRVLVLRPSGFLALGLLVLIATPILRVIGSIFAFVYERDWRYVGITCLVLGVVMISVVLGKG